jgi:hypothetical protein
VTTSAGGRRIWQDGHLIEHVLPRTWRQIPLTGDNFELTLPQSSKRGGKRGAGGHCECMAWDKRALQAIENVLQKEVILFHRAYRQNGNDSVRRDLGGVLHYDIPSILFFSESEKSVDNKW